jgi:hypothetical protein
MMVIKHLFEDECEREEKSVLLRPMAITATAHLIFMWRASASETNEISGVSFYFRLFAEAQSWFNAHCSMMMMKMIVDSRI